MKRNLIIADDFYGDPDEVRNFALSVPYARDRSAVYAGENSIESYWNDDLRTSFERIVGFPIQVPNNSHTGRFRISPALAPLKQDIHFDGAQWSGVLFLNPPSQCQGGTSLWKHKATGWEEYPTFEQMKAAGFSDPGEMVKKIVYEDGLDRSKWEEVFRVPMKYNRLVLFRSHLWHSHTMNFGDRPDNSRLIQTFFFIEQR